MSGQDFDFGLGDILQENDSGHTLARGGAGFLAVLFLILSSITTFGFFSTYAADIGAWAGPTAARPTLPRRPTYQLKRTERA